MESTTMSSQISITVPVPGARVRWLALGLAVGLLTAAVVAPLFGPRTLLANDPTGTSEHTISVSGTGRVLIDPDIADLRLGVTVEKPTVKEARDANAQAMSAVIASLRQLKVAEKDIQTSTLSLTPVYDYRANGEQPRLIGYNLTNAVAVTIRDLDVVGDAIDAALSAGATTLDGVTFRVEDQAAAEKQAREAAMAEAKAKAQTLASAAGVSIQGVASVSETVSPVPYPVYFSGVRDLAAEGASTPVEPGTNEVSVTVAVVYVIG
jgi:uncharacterized protein YggE